MKANKTKQLIYEYTEIAFGNRERDNKRLHDMHQVVAEELNQLEADAELGRAVRKAFSQAYNVNPSYGYVRGALLSEEALIEWAQGVE